MEAVARVMQQREYQEKAETDVKQRVDDELKSRQRAELEADVKARKEAEERAKIAAEERARRAEEEALLAAAKPRKKTKILVPAVLSAVLLVGAGIGGLHLMPLTPWINAAEKIASERTGEPVTIGSMRYAIFPSPALTLEKLTIGPQQDIKVPSATVAIGPIDLFSAEKEASEIELNSPSVDQDALARVLAFARAPAARPRLSVKKILVRGARVTLRGLEPLSLNVDAQLDKNGAVSRASVRLADGTLTADVVPKGDSANLVVRASRFTPPLGPAYVFNDLELTGTLTPTELREIQAEGSVFGGKLKASGQVRYASAITVEGKFTIANLNLEPLVALFTSELSITGSADINGLFTLQAARLGALFDQPRVDFGFSANQGMIKNVDLVRAAQASGREGIRGGRTRYTNMTGVVAVARNRASFQQLRIASNSMNAAGSFDVQGKGDLSGKLGIQVGPPGTVVAQSQIVVTGDVRNPVLR
jgi:hypothetical protein